MLCNQNRAHEQSCENSECLSGHFKKTEQRSCDSVSWKHEKALGMCLCASPPQGYQKGVAYSRWLITTHCRLSNRVRLPLCVSMENHVFATHDLSLVYSLNSCELYSYKLGKPLEYKLSAALNETGPGIAAVARKNWRGAARGAHTRRLF